MHGLSYETQLDTGVAWRQKVEAEKGKKRKENVVFCTSIVWQRQHCDSGLGQVGARFDISSAFLSSFGAFRCLKLFSMSANGSITRIDLDLPMNAPMLAYFIILGKESSSLLSLLPLHICCGCALPLLVLILRGLRRKEPATLG